MKIKKFLALAFTALVATFATSTLTSCSNGDKEDGDFYLSARAFANGKQKIRTNFVMTPLLLTSTGADNTLTMRKPDIIVFSPTGEEEDEEELNVTDIVVCTGYIGAEGGTQYECQFVYTMTEERIAKVEVSTNPAVEVDDELFIAGCGFAAPGNDNNNNNGGGNQVGRAEVDKVHDINLVFFFDYNTGMGYVQGAGTGVLVEDEDGNEGFAAGMTVIASASGTFGLRR